MVVAGASGTGTQYTIFPVLPKDGYTVSLNFPRMGISMDTGRREVPSGRNSGLNPW